MTQPKNQGVIRLSFEQLAVLLNLPEQVTVKTMYLQPEQDVAFIKIESALPIENLTYPTGEFQQPVRVDSMTIDQLQAEHTYDVARNMINEMKRGLAQ